MNSYREFHMMWWPLFLILTSVLFVSMRIKRAADPDSGQKVGESRIFGGYITILFAIILLATVLAPSIYIGVLIGYLFEFVLASLYYIALYYAMPVLRSKISAVACSSLWLIPGATAILTANYTWRANSPLLWIRLGKGAAKVLVIIAAVYLAAALVLFARSIVSHMIYRKKVLSASYPVTDEAVISILMQEAELTRSFKRYVPDPVVSTEVRMPVAIGLFLKKTRIVLPDADYTPEELRLIFRHELIHIARRDSHTKMDMALLCALFWPIPQMRRSAQRCAEDLELSCDEMVLRGLTEEDRIAYAGLILSRPSESKGFTTSLSAGAESLRYRLREILTPETKRSGAAFVCMVLVALVLLFRSAGLSVYAGKGQEIIFGKQDAAAAIQWEAFLPHDGDYFLDEVTIDSEKLNEYLSGLELDHAGWEDPEIRRSPEIKLYYHAPQGKDSMTLSLGNDYIMVSGKGSGAMGIYRIPGGLDWDFIDSLY